ncbi:MAG: sulfite exporter TauE/SafE family protein [Hyphomicrobiaceae bacterium TMED74]|nr:permease [Filomicrobium sp.]RPG47521.1 MAG: sulfite exporter TauE/SafE family protein [Hyphomicrobiaceae bacterium TMED74]
MGLEFLLFVIAGALAGGFVNGLAGFGTGITALGLWLYVLPPTVAATLVVVCSAAAQVLTLPRIWHSIESARVLPFIVPGLIAVPIGTVLLAYIDVRAFKLGIAALLIAYSAYTLFLRNRLGQIKLSRVADIVVGFSGGMLGGLAGLSGPPLTVWGDLRNWTKEIKRSTFQAFNLSILCAALIAHITAGFFTRELLVAAGVALPATFLGAWLGAILYSRVSDKRFNEIILVLLGVSGIVLIWTNA